MKQYFGLALAAALFLTWLASGCRQQNEEQAADATGGLSAELVRLTPEGWELFDEVLRFTAANLYEQINGRAEFYLAYDMVGMSFASFEKSGDDVQFIDVSIYDMGSPINAFGVFSGERSPGEPSVELGRDAYRSGANYYIWKGQDYIQIIASDTTDELQRIGMDIARGAAGLVVDSGEPVWGPSALPEEDRVAGSEKYFLVDAMGLDFMRDTFTADYRMDDNLVTVFVSRRDSAEVARAAVDLYVEHAKRYGDAVERLTEDGVELVSCDMGGSYDTVFQKGRLVGGVVGVEVQNVALQTTIDLWRQLHDE